MESHVRPEDDFCVCGGVFVDLAADVVLGIDDAEVRLPDVPQRTCSVCGRRAYRAGVLVELEAVLRGAPAPTAGEDGHRAGPP